MKCNINDCACSTAYNERKCRCENCRAWRSDRAAKNRDKDREWLRSWQEDNREQTREHAREWAKDNREYVNNKNAVWRATLAGQTPDLTEEETDQIKAVYREARLLTEETGIPHQVDHIHPLSKGGLHHPDNLQVLTAAENQKKGARHV